MSVKPTYMKLTILLGICLFCLGISGFAQQDTSKTAVDTTQIDKKFFNLGLQYFEQDIYEIAIQYFDSAIVYNQEYMDAYAYRGISKLEIGHYMDAIEDFDYALILEPGYAEVYIFRGDAKFQMEDPEKACEDWYEAYALGLRTAMKRIEKNCELDKKKK